MKNKRFFYLLLLAIVISTLAAGCAARGQAGLKIDMDTGEIRDY